MEWDFFWENGDEDCPDLVIENGQIKFDPGLEMAVFISIFTNRFVELDELPQNSTDQMGWWADLIAEQSDDLIGSTAWTFERSKINDEVAVRFEDGIRESLQWMLDDGVASEVNVSSEVFQNENIILSITITKPQGTNIPFKFKWDGQALKISEEAA